VGQVVDGTGGRRSSVGEARVPGPPAPPEGRPA